MATQRRVPGFMGYAVGDDGTVWTQKILGSRGKLGREWRKLSPSRKKSGRLEVSLCKDGVIYYMHVSWLVLMAFVGPRPDGMEACHKNDIQDDNSLDNLYWGTKQDNTRDKHANGRVAHGERSGNSKLTDSKVRQIKGMREEGYTCEEISAFFNMSPGNIAKIVRGDLWKHVV